MPNRYFICSRLRPPVEFDIADERPADDAEIAYFIRGFQILERQYGLDGYTVCFAWSALTRLPRIGPDVIAVIYGDEHCRVPPYVKSVAAVIKCHGLFPIFVPRRRPLRLAQIELAEFLRNAALWLPTGWRWMLSPMARARCHLVPVGYGLPTDLEPPPFDERPYLTAFLGSVTKPAGCGSLRALVGTPKAYCRNTLVQVLRSLQARYGEDAIPLRLTGGFQESLQDAGRGYFDVLARTKLCVAPRGTSRETLRICEGLRFGCVVIADRLPPHPFYRNSPIIQIEDWRTLPALIEELLADPARLRKLHRRSLRYWQDVLSEQALAARCAAALGLVARPA
jgi:hypothetical protein